MILRFWKQTSDSDGAGESDMLRQQLHSLVGSVGTLFMVFYISVTSTVLEPLQCQDMQRDCTKLKYTTR
eukprot:6485731-Amphidinium_carterae.2